MAVFQLSRVKRIPLFPRGKRLKTNGIGCPATSVIAESGRRGDQGLKAAVRYRQPSPPLPTVLESIRPERVIYRSGLRRSSGFIFFWYSSCANVHAFSVERPPLRRS